VFGTTKANISYIIIFFDIISIFFLWIAFQIHGYYEELEEIEIEGVILDGSDFAVEVKNIPMHSDVRVFKAQLWRHIETVLLSNPKFAVSDHNDPNAYKIAQIDFALANYTIMEYYKLRVNYEKQDRILTLKQAILDKSNVSEEKKNKSRQVMARRREINRERHEKNEERIKVCKSHSNVKAIRAFVTMESMEGKKRIKRAYRAKKFRRCWTKKRYIDRYMEGKWLKVYDAPRPSILIWENIPISKANR